MRDKNPDPLASELIRFYIRQQRSRHQLNVPGFAETLGVTRGAVHNWLTDPHRGISEQYWTPIAKFFDFDTYDELLATARAIMKAEAAPRR